VNPAWVSLCVRLPDAVILSHGIRDRDARARVEARALRADWQQKMLIAAIGHRAKRLQAPADMPPLRDRATSAHVLTVFGAQLVREVSDPTVVAVFRLAIAEAGRAPEVARTLDFPGRETSRAALRQILTQAREARLIDGRPPDVCSSASQRGRALARSRRALARPRRHSASASDALSATVVEPGWLDAR
jgi:hypothetical protein